MPRTANFTVSQNGVLAFKSVVGVTASDEQRSLVWFDRNGNATPVATTGDYAGIDLSPDGRRLAVHKHEGSGGDIWMFDSALGRMQRITFDTSQENNAPIWSPDGKRVAFASLRKGQWGLYVKPADGDSAEELLIESATPKSPSSWSPDGKLLVYTESDDIWAVPTTGEHKPFSLVTSSVVERFPQVSPDGKWLAYQSQETGRAEIYVRQFPSGPGKWQVSTEGGQWPRWRSNGAELYFVVAPNVVSAAVREKGGSLEFGVPVPVLTLSANPSDTAHDPHYHRFAVSPDGQRFLMGQPVGGSAAAVGGLADRIATIADGGSEGGAALSAANLTVVLNWTKMLKRK
jgi:dipeptidyl aminopeptidase/acylaminoacyl peptidase